MKGFVFDCPGSGDMRELPLPQPDAGEALLRVEYCGVCGTDLNIWRGTDRSARGIVLGHEYCGTVEAVGEGVTCVKVGDRVGVDPNIPCGRCEACRKGRVNLCTALTALGVDVDGGFAEYNIAPENQLFLLPAAMSFEEAALVEPVACALNGVGRADIALGDDVLILGGGPMGLLMVQLSHLRGAGRVLLCELSPRRREMGRLTGADEVYTTMEEVLARAGGAPDVVIECIGKPETQRQALEAVKPGGSVVLFGDGDLTREFTVPSQLFYAKELTARGAALNPFTHAQAFRVIASGRMNLTPLISRKIPLAALRPLLENGYEPGDVKVLVAPGAQE